MDFCGETQSNYRTWRSRMQSFLEGEDLWDIVCGTNTIPAQENHNALKDWKKKNGKAEFILKSSVADNLFHHIVHCNSASSIWKTLKSLYSKLSDEDEARLRVLEDELENTRQGDLTVSQFFSKIRNLSAEIVRVDPMEPVSEARLKCIVDHGLRPEFNPSVQFIKRFPVQVQQPSFQEYEILLVSVEASLKTSPEVANSVEEESDLNAENQIMVEDQWKEEVMAGGALEESVLNVNNSDHSPGDDGEEFLESDDEYEIIEGAKLQEIF